MLIKICGLTLREDALFAAECGADFLGIVLAEASPRRARVEETRAILALNVPQPKYLVFGYDDVNYIRQTFTSLAQAGTGLQIMADHPQVDELVKLAPTELILPSISAAVKFHAADLDRWDNHPLVLFDSHRGAATRSVSASQAGGTGKVFEHSNIAGVRRRYLLAGGLNPENIAAIISGVNPPGVDTASGVEATPGVKDHDKVRRFIRNARQAAQSAQAQQ